MASSSSTQVPFNILEVLQGPPTRPAYYRISVESSIKYLIAPQPLSGLPDIHGDHLGFNAVPMGDWDIASLIRNAGGKLVVSSTEKKRFPDATPVWHLSNIDLLELWRLQELGEYHDNDNDNGDNLQLRGHIPSAVFPGSKHLGAAKVAAFWNLDFEGEHNHGLSQESHIYSLIQGTSIAPKFLAHLTDNHERVVGYVLESVPAREADIGDLDLCRDVLQKLHNLGIAHGHLTKDAFLIRQETPMAQIQFFFSSYKTIDRDVLDKEMSSLEEVLQQRPLQEPVHDEKLDDEITAIQ